MCVKLDHFAWMAAVSSTYAAICSTTTTGVPPSVFLSFPDKTFLLNCVNKYHTNQHFKSDLLIWQPEVLHWLICANSRLFWCLFVSRPLNPNLKGQKVRPVRLRSLYWSSELPWQLFVSSLWLGKTNHSSATLPQQKPKAPRWVKKH